MECSAFQFCTLSLQLGLCVGGSFNARSTFFNSPQDIRTRNLTILFQNMNTDLKQIAVCSKHLSLMFINMLEHCRWPLQNTQKNSLF